MTPEPVLRRSAPRGTLLLVEDEASLRTLLVRFLERAEYAVEPCGDGEETLRGFAIEPERFVAVVLDLTLPDMSGEDLIERLHTIRADLPVVVCSGTPRSAEAFATPEAPALFLQKPFLPARLVEALALLLTPQSSSESSSS